jgi:hypothetical protein
MSTTLSARLAEIAEKERQEQAMERAMDAFLRKVTTPGR